MTYTSKDEWDTSISSVGGAKDVHLVSSPWSHNPSANPLQGILTHGVLINEYEPPEIMIEPAVDGYFYQDRLDMSKVNERASVVGSGEEEKFGRKKELYVAPSRRAFKNVTKPKKEGYNPGIPGLVGSNLHQEGFIVDSPVSIVVVILLVVATIGGIVVALVFAKEKWGSDYSELHGGWLF